MIRAVFWDFGGVILTSPFDAFNEYERARGLPVPDTEAQRAWVLGLEDR